MQRSIEAAVNSATSEFFRNYGRVIAVVFFWEEWLEQERGRLVNLFKFREITNQGSRFFDQDDAYVIRAMVMQGKPNSWVSFADLVAGIE